MSRLCAVFASALVLLQAATLFAQSPDDAEIRLVAANDGPAWVGEKVDVYLDLWTRDLSFSGQAFTLPEARGGYLLQADSTTLKLTERRAGASWQGLRYVFSLYPQRPGTVTVPPFDVRFSTGAGYGSESRDWSFTTQELDVEVVLPPGAEAGALLVTTTEFSLDARWEPEPPEPGRIELKVGDALVLYVQRVARGVPGMVFAPLPELSVDGLGVYPDSPVVQDRVSRGDLTGTRTDRVTLVCERPGTYRLPALGFQWWDPERQTLNRDTVPGLTVEVIPNPAWAAAPESARGDGAWDFVRRLLWLVPAALLAWWPGWPIVRAAAGWLRRELRARRLAPLNPRGPRESSG